jgi:2-aminoadipate transaminase
MDFKFSESLKNMKPSEIRELLKYASKKDFISFSGGMPNPATFPFDEIRDIIDEVMTNYGALALQYGNTGGLNDLREEIARMVHETESIKTDYLNVIVTSGSQQGLYELAKVMVNPGDPIITEEPTYVGAISAFDSNKAEMHSIRLEDDGMDIHMAENEIRKLINAGRPPKFIYTIPTFQNPTGISMSLEKRKHLLEVSSRYSIPIVEDNPYGELRYYGQKLPSLKSMENDNNVIYMGTFSKVMCPGFRLGYTIGPDEYVNRANLLKQALDLSSSTFSQYVAWLYLKRGVMKTMVPKAIKLYRGQMDAMLNALKEGFPDGSKWSRPEGGMFIWATVDSRINTSALLKDAIEAGIAYVSGNSFSPSRTQGSSMRLNFTFAGEKLINEGIHRLGGLIGKKLEILESA